MVSSNTYAFGTSTQIDDLIRESCDRIGIIGNELTGYQIQSAIMSANLELTQWMGKIPLSWTRRRLMFTLYNNQAIYQIPTSITNLVDVVATQLNRLNTGGTAFTSNGGNAANCFNPNTTAGCTQVAPNGSIGYDYGVGVQNSIFYVGITPLAESTYTLAVDYSFDNVNWQTIYTTPAQVYFANQITWFVITNTLNARAWRIRETDGATLAIQQIYFSQPTTQGTGDRWLTALSYTEWMQIATKMNIGFPSSYFFDAQINPTMTLWPVPGPGTGGFTNILYTGYQYIQDVTLLFQQFNVPQRFYEALVAGIAARLAQKPDFAKNLKPGEAAQKKQLADEAFQLATLTDATNVTLRFQPDFTSYGR